MANKVEWFEVLGQDAAKLRGFYGELFGWKFHMAPDPSMDYGMTDPASTGIGGGIGKSPQGPGWVTFYVSVDDVAATLARAQKLGAKQLMPPTVVGDGTTIAMFADPEGHPIGVAKSKT